MKKTLQKTIFHVSKREKKNTADKAKKQLKGNVYGLSRDSIAIEMDSTSFQKLYSKEGDTSVIYLQIDENKKTEPVLIDDVQRASVGRGIIHVTFRRIDLTEKIEAEISVSLIGETKIDGAVVSLVKDSVLIEALPTDFPEEFEVDISVLKEIGDTITLADLKYDAEKVTLILPEGEETNDITLLVVQALQEEVEETEEVFEESPVETKTEEKTE